MISVMLKDGLYYIALHAVSYLVQKLSTLCLLTVRIAVSMPDIQPSWIVYITRTARIKARINYV